MSTSDSHSIRPVASIIAEGEDTNNNGENDIVDPDEFRQIDKKHDPAICEKNPSIVKPHKNAGLDAQKTQIQQFYSKQKIFITGGTGFLGKVLIEKLLRTCTDIAIIYVLTRSKNEKDTEERLDDTFQSVLFDRLKAEVPDFRNKIVPIKGDLCAEKLGLSHRDINLLTQNVSIVFHIGATVRFKEELKTAGMINVNATKYILDMAKSMKNLKVFIHVSTIYANCHQEHNDEIFYPCPITHQTFLTIIKNLKSGEVSEQIAEAFALWPNTYTFTKAIAESLVRDASEELPIGIFRPSIVISSANEPLVGWVDNYYGPMTLVTAFYKGLLKYLWCDPNCTANLVPVDKVINGLIVAAWDVFNKPGRYDSHTHYWRSGWLPLKKGIETLIYNYVSTNDAPLTWGKYFDTAQQIAKEYRLKQWELTITLIKNKILFKIYCQIGHTLPAILLDTWKNGRNKRSLRKAYDKLHRYMEIMGYFATRKWTYNDYNVQTMWHRLDGKDQHLFNFNMQEFNWQEYLENHFKGMLIYLFKKDLNALKANK